MTKGYSPYTYPAHKDVRDNIREKYESLPEYVKADLVEAISWANDTLIKFEGEGHHIDIHHHKTGGFTCTFSKSAWASDFEGKDMPTAAEAIVHAVCEWIA